jgi:hypothetical protein
LVKPVFLPLLFGAMLMGCEGALAPAAAPAAPQAVALSPIASAAPGDSLAAFAARSTPGATGVVDGQPARLARSYISAGGRECREVVLGAGTAQRAAVACREADGSFVSVRPLLRGAR